VHMEQQKPEFRPPGWLAVLALALGAFGRQS
jgi:MYXO-CTERM domain-containing protein